ncbi:nucleotidyltransferase domain-containing protein [Marisediminicola senii]|uniref:nucleotidyltransferase domain-containing protein n=1 Tax=Marisediminicola senii TaxID=2711233 RepID=UPI0013ED0F4F|nr:nucleotidyltransferase domain-containing protein [Marisediminicola senii]
MDPIAAAGRFMAATFPNAEAAVVAGSAARGTRTRTSDIDILAVGGDDLFDDDRDALAATFDFEGQPVEVFAYTREGFERWANPGMTFRPTIVRMLVEGTPIRGDLELALLRARWKPVLDAGPDPSPHELARRRYVITDLLDDLVDAQDTLEQRVIAASLFERTAELMLLSRHRWLGQGKHLVRELREWNSDRANALARPLLQLDFAGFAERVQAELDAAGGRVQAGFVR